MSRTLTWEQIVSAVDRHGNSANGREAWENEEDLDTEETALIDEDDGAVIVVGTDDGDAWIKEHSLKYPDGVVVTYENDHHRETCVRDVLPRYIADKL
jgi:hypothetical protein